MDYDILVAVKNGPFNERKTETSPYGSDMFIEISLMKYDDDYICVMIFGKKDDMNEFLKSLMLLSLYLCKTTLFNNNEVFLLYMRLESRDY